MDTIQLSLLLEEKERHAQIQSLFVVMNVRDSYLVESISVLRLVIRINVISALIMPSKNVNVVKTQKLYHVTL